MKLAKGIKVLNFGSGHAWGLLGLLVELTETGNIIRASDAIYSVENLRCPPVILPGIIHVHSDMKSGREDTLYSKETNTQVWYGHVP